MQEYRYEVVDRDGRLLKGEIEAESPLDAVRALSTDGRTVVEVNERQIAPAAIARRRLRGQDVVVALHELATLLESGVALGDAIRAQSRGSSHPTLGTAFAAIGRELTKGESLLTALRTSTLPLPEYVYHLVEAGELSGRLAQSLRQAVDQMSYDQRIAAEIRGALTYPAILIVSGIAAVALVFVFVVPQFANLLDDDRRLPLLAEVVLRTGVWFNESRWLLAGGLAAAAGAAAMLFPQPAVRQRANDVLAGLPLVKQWYTEVDTAKWASIMAAMLTSRVELMEALDLASRGVRISRRKTTLEQAAGDVRGGVALSAALEKRHALTPTGYNLLRVGEQSGQLAEMLRALATLYEENGSRRMKQVLTLIEPLAILLIGGFLGVIMIGIILAITSVNEIAL